ncbi:MAG TPA: ABC transporter permease subunit [Acidimicrobiales bacterium]|nr:ABC transporter permease subunit [Acidimicrobiales bacterium]
MIRVEWTRQVRRIRTWACLALLGAVPIIVTVSSYLDPPRQQRLDINLFTILTSSGINVGVISLVVMGQFFLVVVVAAFSGESVAGEATWGTLRYLLVRPVSRARLVLAKLTVAYVLTLIAVLVIVGAGLIAGTIAFGWHDATALEQTRFFPLPVSVPADEALGRLALASGYVALTMLAVVAIGIFLSTLTDSTAAAVVSTVVVVVASQVLTAVPSLGSLKPYLPTRYWDEWRNLFTGRTAQDMWKGVASALAFTLIFTVIALWRFRRKDILS